MKQKLLTDGPVTAKSISSAIEKANKRRDAGGHSIFLGQVRADIIGNKKVTAIEYTAYEEMVVAEADKIINSILEEFDDVKSIYILHSTGHVNAGEISLFVLVSAGHRHQAMQACSKTVELIKHKLPVWKKEIFNDNSYKWRDGEPA